MRVQDGEVQDDLDRKQMCAEDLMMKMRMTRGVSDDELFAAAVVIPGALDVFNSLVRDKLVKREDGRWKPTFGRLLFGATSFTGGFMNWLRKVAFEECAVAGK